MNPEVRQIESVIFYTGLEAPIVDFVFDRGPLEDFFSGQAEQIKVRAQWLLDFTDNHPLFYDYIEKEDVTEPDVRFADVVYRYKEGLHHRKEWKNFSREDIAQAAGAMALWGYDMVGELLLGLEYRWIERDYYPELDAIHPFRGVKVRNKLPELSEDVTFKRILKLIVLTSERSYGDKNELLAVFAAVVGFGHAYVDALYPKDEYSKKVRHMLRDQVTLFALHHFDRNLGDYLGALNKL